MKDVLNELNEQKDLNVLMRDEVASLEMSLKNSKVLPRDNAHLWSSSFISFKFIDTVHFTYNVLLFNRYD